MTLTDLWKELLALVPANVNLHLNVELNRYRKSRHCGERITVEFSGWAMPPNDSTVHFDAASCDEVLQKFRSNVLPELGLTPAPDVAKELDCELPVAAD